MIIALLAVAGAHWGALQSVAWTTMLADNLHSVSFHDAVAKTFDGKHPCPLCKAVAAGKNAEKKSDFTLELKKLEFPPASERFVLVAPTQFKFLRPANFSAKVVVQKPPTPPPRSFFA